MTQYVKKRVPVEAIQVDPNTGPLENFKKYMEFTEGNFQYSLRRADPDPDVPMTADTEIVETLQVFDMLHKSWITLKRGDWIVRGVRGEFYPVEEVVFEETYEEYVD